MILNWKQPTEKPETFRNEWEDIGEHFYSIQSKPMLVDSDSGYQIAYWDEKYNKWNNYEIGQITGVTKWADIGLEYEL